MNQPDPQAVLERGRACLELLQNPHFLAVVDELSAFHVAAMVACPTEPAHADTLKHHHHCHSALRDIAAQIQAYAQAAAELEDQMAEPEDDL